MAKKDKNKRSWKRRGGCKTIKHKREVCIILRNCYRFSMHVGERRILTLAEPVSHWDSVLGQTRPVSSHNPEMTGCGSSASLEKNRTAITQRIRE